MATAVSFISDGVVVPANFYAPAAPQRGAALVVAYGADGLTDDQSGPWATMIDTIAGEIAALGIPVTVPDYFRATDTAPGLFRDGIEAGLAQIMTHRQAWQTVLADAGTDASARTGIAPPRFGLLGFSLGGHLSLRLRDQVAHLVAFYPPQIDLTVTHHGLQLVAQLHHGESDPLVSFALNAHQVEQLLLAEGATVNLFPYPGAGHGFGSGSAADQQAWHEAKQRTVAFFAAHA